MDVLPFFAYRPPAPSAARVASPPYDVVTAAQARSLARGNPDSFLHVSRPEIDLPEGTDEHAAEVYRQGRTNLMDLCARGVLVRDAEPHLYIYAQAMGAHRQTGVVACVRVEDYLADRIKKHEKTRADKEDDRTRHIAALAAHDEPVFLTFQADPAIDAAVAELCRQEAVYDFSSDDGVHHRLWVVDAARSRALASLFAERVETLYVADGHHRSAAAARAHRDLVGDDRDHGAFPAVIFPHDQMNIMAYNRLVRSDGQSPEQILAQIGAQFELSPADERAPAQEHAFGIYCGGAWHRALVRPGSFDGADPVERLDCQILQRLLLEPVFGIADPRRDQRIDFVGGIHGASELMRRVDRGDAQLAIQLFPTRVEQVMAVSDAGRSMPPKSTWFEPKLKSGLFVHFF